MGAHDEPEPGDGEMFPTWPTLEDREEQRRRLAAIPNVLAQLSPRARQVVYLVTMHDRPVRVAAEMTGISRHTADHAIRDAKTIAGVHTTSSLAAVVSWQITHE